MLTKFQKEIVSECLKRRNGCICVPMGTGKTVIALELIRRIGSQVPALVICSKTLIGSWIAEVEKFYKNRLCYVVYHPSFMSKKDFESFQPMVGTDLIITTSETLSKAYNLNGIAAMFVVGTAEDRGGPFPVLVNRYQVPTQPMIRDLQQAQLAAGWFYAIQWKCLIVDEVQQYTNIDTVKCQSICSLVARRRWMLSGTPINEPTTERVMGYYMLIGNTSIPNCKPDVETHLRTTFTGVKDTMVVRTLKQVDFAVPECRERIITHELLREERLVYESLKNVVTTLLETIKEHRDNITLVREFNAYLLSMVVYLRQFLVCALVPYATLMMNGTKTNEMSIEFQREISRLNLDLWLQDKNASRSTRIVEMEKVLTSHSNERCIVFNCFRTNLKICAHYFAEDLGRQVISIDSTDSPQRRMQKIQEFEASTNGILLLTFSLGAEGLNLQKSHVLLVADTTWNDGQIQQAIARIVRRGQSSAVCVYFFTSNTGVEQGVFNKQDDKKMVVAELLTGTVKKTIRKLNIREVMKLVIDADKNTMLLANIRGLSLAPVR